MAGRAPKKGDAPCVSSRWLCFPPRPRSPTQVQTLRALRVWGWHAMTRRLLGRFHPSWTGEWPLASPCCPDPRRSCQRFSVPAEFRPTFYWGTSDKNQETSRVDFIQFHRETTQLSDSHVPHTLIVVIKSRSDSSTPRPVSSRAPNPVYRPVSDPAGRLASRVTSGAQSPGPSP